MENNNEEISTEPKHAIFSPSTLERTVICPASHKERISRPTPPQNEHAARGAYLHDCVFRAFTEGKHTVTDIENIEDRFMVLEALDYFDNLLDRIIVDCQSTEYLPELHVDVLERDLLKESKFYKFEHKVYVGKIDAELADVWGTADVVLYNPVKKELHCIDWKFGKGVKVFANQNIQGITYLAGALADFPDTEKLKFHVVQTSMDHFDTYSTTTEDVLKFLEDVLKPAIKDALSSSPTYNPSPKACRFCEAKSDCVARHELNVKNARKVFAMYREFPRVSDEEINAFMQNAEELVNYINALKKRIKAKLQQGDKVEGYKLGYSRANRVWKDPKETAKWLFTNTDLSDKEIFKFTLRGPAAIEKADKVLKKNEEFQSLIHTPEGKVSLVKDTDAHRTVTKDTQATSSFAKYL